MARDLIFIGHANPEDNDFTLWLQAKLINEGYKAECDLSFLIGGEDDYWKRLQDLLENNSAKYILVLSKHTFTKQGVIDEWEQVKIIAKRYRITDFIYILKIDNVPFDVRIGVPTKNHFRFDISWASGLKKLLIKLFRDSVPKSNTFPLSVEAWSKNRYSTNQGIIEKRETYYSNWLQISDAPEKIFFYRYLNTSQAEVAEKNIEDFPVIRHDNFIITFSEDIPIHFDNYEFEIIYSKRIEILTGNAFQKYETEDFPTYNDLKRFLVRLLKEAWNKFLSQRGLHLYEMSQNTKCFHYKQNQLPKDKVFFTYNNKSTYKQLVGDFFEATWHYGLSATVLLYPIFCYSLRAHLVFSDDGIEIWKNKNKIHKARRTKGKSFYNKEWRALLLGFLASLSDDKRNIKIPITLNSNLNLDISTITFYCDYGYEEPKTDGRLVPLDYFEEVNDEDELSEFDESELNESEDGNTVI
jgi:hypothetical protein